MERLLLFLDWAERNIAWGYEQSRFPSF
jgi:hypothetical protein